MYSGATYTYYEDVYYSTDDLEGYFAGKQTSPTSRPTLRIESVEYSDSNLMPSGHYAQQHDGYSNLMPNGRYPHQHDDYSNPMPRGRYAQQHDDWYGLNKQQPHWSITSTEYYMHDPNRHISPYNQTKDANQLTGDKFSNGISNNEDESEEDDSEDDNEDDSKDTTLYTSINTTRNTRIPDMIPMRRRDIRGRRAETTYPNPRARGNDQRRFRIW